MKKVLACAIASGVSMYRVMLSPQLYGLDVNKGTAARLSAFAELVHGFTERAGAGAPASDVARHIMRATGLMLEYTCLRLWTPSRKTPARHVATRPPA